MEVLPVDHPLTQFWMLHLSKQTLTMGGNLLTGLVIQNIYPTQKPQGQPLTTSHWNSKTLILPRISPERYIIFQ